MRISGLIEPNEIYTTKDLEILLGLTQRHFQRQIKKGNLKTIGINEKRGYLIKGIDFIDWLFTYHCNGIFRVEK